MKIEEGYKPSAEDEPILRAIDQAAIIGFWGGVIVTLIIGALVAALSH